VPASVERAQSGFAFPIRAAVSGGSPTHLTPVPAWGVTMTATMDRYRTLDPDDREVIDAELVVSDDVLVKAFALGPGAEISPHEHADSTNVFHVTRGTVTVLREGTEATVEAPGVVHHPRGTVHGARNDTDDVAVLTASLAPMPG